MQRDCMEARLPDQGTVGECPGLHSSQALLSVGNLAAKG